MFLKLNLQIKCASILIVCLMFFQSALYASGHPSVKYLGIEQGLSNNAVTCIYQDSRGFMWFGTYDGLNRYDGYGFKVYRNVIGDSNSIGFNSMATLEGDAMHRIWVGGINGLSVFDPVSSLFLTPSYLPVSGEMLQKTQGNVHVIRNLPGGHVLVGTHEAGLLDFSSNLVKGKQVALRGSNGQIGKYDVSAIECDQVRHTVWVFIQREGLFAYDVATQNLKPISTFIKQANCIRVDQKGCLWLGNDLGLYRFDWQTHAFTGNLMPYTCKITTLMVNKKSELWIASDGSGLWQLSSSSQKAITLGSAEGEPLVNSNAVYAVYEDHDGYTWIGTLRGGINLIEPRKSAFQKIVYHPQEENNIVNNFILSFCEDVDKKVWVGTDGAGLRLWNRKTNSFTEYKNDPSDPRSLSSNFITGVTRDFRNDLWVSTWFGGIDRLNRTSNTFDHFTCYNPKTNAAENHVWLLYEDSSKRLWASTTNEGCLYWLDRSANRFELFDPSIVNLQCLTEDRRGALWGGNYNSLIRIDREHK
jgi:ligand-binding sensor domain-containing protein